MYVRYASKVRLILARFECECLDKASDNLEGSLDKFSISKGAHRGVN